MKKELILEHIASRLLVSCFMLVSFLTYSSTPKIEAKCFSETLIFIGIHGVLSKKIEIFILTLFKEELLRSFCEVNAYYTSPFSLLKLYPVL